MTGAGGAVQQLLAPAILAACMSVISPPGAAAALEFQAYAAANSGIAENSVIIMGENAAILVDAQWLLSDARELADVIARSGRRLKYVLITHAHPDHYWGLEAILARFPQAQVLARAAVVHEIESQFYAKWLHWQLLVPDDIPVNPVIPEAFEGEVVTLEGHEIRWVDLPAAETEAATAYYLPAARVLIAGDLIFAKMHSYLADLDNPKGWITALEQVRDIGPIDAVYPGHGPAGGPELIDAAIRYMQVYASIAKPGVPLPRIAGQMAARFPEYQGELLLWWTRGPGFGVLGPCASGVPARLRAALPPAVHECP